MEPKKLSPEKIRAEIDGLRTQIIALQDSCEHPAFIKQEGAWFKCKFCDKLMTAREMFDFAASLPKE